MDPDPEIRLQVDFWDVGQGDASTIRLPSGEYILIDTGPSPRGNPLVQWFALQPRKTIHSIVVTHNDWDHVGGLTSLVLNPDQIIRFVRFIHDKSSILLSNKIKAIFDALKRRQESGKTETSTLEAGNIIYQDSVFRLVARHPSALDTVGIQPNNSVSAIITLEHQLDGKILIIWGGDALLKTIATLCPKATPGVLFGPHHGCPQDKSKEKNVFSGLLKEINPNCIFISVGRGNTYSHPNKQYIDTATKCNATICCSEVTQKCGDSGRITKSVFQGSGRLGYPVPPGTIQCRGTMRVIVDRHRIHHGEDQEEFLKLVKVIPNVLCST